MSRTTARVPLQCSRWHFEHSPLSSARGGRIRTYASQLKFVVAAPHSQRKSQAMIDRSGSDSESVSNATESRRARNAAIWRRFVQKDLVSACGNCPRTSNSGVLSLRHACHAVSKLTHYPRPHGITCAAVWLATAAMTCRRRARRDGGRFSDHVRSHAA
jgi:hypothetical protein